MAIVLDDIIGSLRKWGTETVVLAADERVVIKTGPSGALVDMLTERVPDGKTWTVNIGVTIDET